MLLSRGGRFIILRSHLLTDDSLVMVLHLVQVVCLEVIHQDCEAAHELSLFFDASTAPRQVHLVANPVDFLVIQLYASTFAAFRIDTEGIITCVVFLAHGDQRMRALVQINVPGVVDLLEATLLDLRALFLHALVVLT